jgi:thiamine pyrophosphate-dependent acetolactate synthase large subunit-like protein
MAVDPSRSEQYPLRRREVVNRLLADRGDALVVAGLGAPAWDVTAAGDDPLNFPLWGAMGGAVSMGLGLALAQPRRRVIVITGDGEMLMGLGSLATVAACQPSNLAIVVLDNERYGETGMQHTHTAGDTDLVAIAGAAGISRVHRVLTGEHLNDACVHLVQDTGPMFFGVKVRAEALPLVLPPKDGAWLKDRFRLALLGESSVNG